ncbi:hypothetical protein HGRIS_011912 [Hohenbuehelia grisea]|uniref:DUF6699 domain-containing protein n=1 Tax=Hohenbuehelia grisea TaxID=104357 RepID=A0ABR3JXZ5_9AGAR
MFYTTAPSTATPHSYVADKLRSPTVVSSHVSSSHCTSPSPVPSAWSTHASLGSHEPRTPWAPNLATVELPRADHRSLARGPSYSPLQLNPLLAYNASKQLMYKLKYRLDPRKVANPALLHDPATFPPTSTLVLTVAQAPGNWACTIRAPSPASPVTAGQVLNALYDLFQAPMSKEEYGALHPAMTAEVSLAFQRRTSGSGADYRHGLRRIDSLGFKTLFLGLMPSPDGSGAWMVCTGAPSS